MTKKWIALSVLLMAAAAGIFAQSLENNEFYRKSVEFANLSQKAIDDGEYELAREHALKSQEYAALSRQYIADMLLQYRARSSYTAAKARMDLANRLNLKNRDANLYNEASKYFTDATTQYNAKDWDNSITNSRKVVELLKDIDPRYTPPARGDGLAAFYEVKLNLARRDCLWRIAEFDFVYGDPWQWKRLYEANKDSFPEPDNPDLILPGMILKIPPIRGETRSGTR